MLDKLAEKVTDIFSHLRKFKETKVYNYKYHILAILLIVIFVVFSMTIKSESSDIPQTELAWCISSTSETETLEETETTTTMVTTTTEPVEETSTKKQDTTTTTKKITTETTLTEITTAARTGYIGRFKITVYCACFKCCGKYALNRPVDENGNVIVKGRAGRVLIPHYSIATDPKVIPLGTEITINGKTYRADDTGGAVKGNVIDIYAGTNHEEAERVASAMSSQYADVYWK